MISSLMRLLVAVLLLSCTWSETEASPPDPTQSDVDPIVLATSSGAPGEFEYVVQLRNINGIPEAGWIVSVDFSGSNVRPHAVQNPGTDVDCSQHTVSQPTDSDGRSVFRLRLAGFDHGMNVEVRGSGVLMGLVPARSTDLDGDGTTGLSDLEHFRSNFFGDPAAPETDWDLDGETGLGDWNLLRAEIFRDASGAVCAN